MRIRAEAKGVDTTIKALRRISRGFPREAVRAIEDGRRKAFTQLHRSIRAESTIKQRRIKQQTFRARKATPAKLVSSIKVTNHRNGVKHFQVRRLGTAQRPRGISLKLWKNKPTEKIRHAFYRKGQWFVRARYAKVAGKRGAQPTSTSDLVQRLPIVFLEGPRVANLVRNGPQIQKAVSDTALNTMIVSLTKRLRRLQGVR